MDNYRTSYGMYWTGPPTKKIRNKDGSVFVFFNGPTGIRSDLVIELWKEVKKKVLGITYKKEIIVIAVFKVATI